MSGRAARRSRNSRTCGRATPAAMQQSTAGKGLAVRVGPIYRLWRCGAAIHAGAPGELRGVCGPGGRPERGGAGGGGRAHTRLQTRLRSCADGAAPPAGAANRTHAAILWYVGLATGSASWMAGPGA